MKFSLYSNTYYFKKHALSSIVLIVSIITLTGLFWNTQVGIQPSTNYAAIPEVTIEELSEAGLYSVLDPQFGNCRSDGVTDCTAAIQRAIDKAGAHNTKNGNERGVVFFSTGNYLVSNTLVVLQDRKMARQNAVQFVGSTEGARPRIILGQGKFNDNNSTNDSSIANKKAVVHFLSCVSGGSETDEGKECDPVWADQRNDNSDQYINVVDGNAAMAMAMGLRNLDFIVKPGNPDAIAIRIAGAQDNILSNIRVHFEENGFAGIYSFIGTNSVVENIEIIGGKYGLMGGDSRWPSINNVKLIDQSVAAISSSNGGMPLSINGFYIEKDESPVISDVGINFNYYSGSNSGGAYALSDGVIKITGTNNNPVIDNRKDRQITMQNVHFYRAKTIIDNGDGDTVNGNENGWTRAVLYANSMDQFTSNGKTNKSSKIENGQKTESGNYSQITNPFELEPNASKLLASHGVQVANLPSPDVIMRLSKGGNPSYIYVKHKGVTPSPSEVGYQEIAADKDVSLQLQEIINNCPSDRQCYILLGRGKYPLKRTIELKPNTTLMGVSNYLSEIVTNPSWNTSEQTSIISTPNDANATTTLAFLKTAYNSDPRVATFNLINWRVGRKSLIYGLMSTRTFQEEKVDYALFKPRSEFLVTESGGGRWFGINTSGNGIDNKWIPNYRGIKIFGTRQPLTIYGLDPEDGGYNCLLNPSACLDSNSSTYPPIDPSSMQVEIRNARNVAIRGFKCEDHNSVNIFNSTNIFASGIGGCTDWYFENVNRYLVLNMASKFNASGRNGEELLINFEERSKSTSLTVYKNESLSYVSRGVRPNFLIWGR